MGRPDFNVSLRGLKTCHGLTFIAFAPRREYRLESSGGSYVGSGLDQTSDNTSALGRDRSVGADNRCRGLHNAAQVG